MEKVTINKIERLKSSDSKGLTSRDIQRRFGKSNDYIELHIHDLGGKLLETTPNYQGYSIPDQIENQSNPNLTSTLFLDPYQHLEEKGYTTGIYNVVCNIHRKKVFSGLQADFKIHEISPSRTELKLTSAQYSEKLVKEAFLNFIGEIEESLFNKDFTLNFGNNINVLGINVAYHNQDECALIKLYEPLPLDLEVGAEFWIVEEIIEPLEFKVDLGNSLEYEVGIPIKGPNFRIDTRLNDSIPSQFKVYNDFLENTHSASLYNVMSHLSSSIELSIDYTRTGTGSLETGYHFENFTHFGSAEERLNNFKYKLELLELYQKQIDEINTIQGSISASSAVTSNINLIEDKKGKLISGLDNYEKFLYYENHPYAWPKVPDFGIGNLQVTGSPLLDESYWLQVGLTECDVFFKPYTLRPTTSSQAVEWYGSTNDLNTHYGGQILSASRFDRDNKHNLVRTIPEHVSMREENAQYLTFTNMVGHYFDQIWLYIDHIGQIRNAHNSFKDGISKDLVYTALSSLGVEVFDQFENEELFEYIIGTNKAKSGSFGTYDAPDGTTMITSSLVTCDNGGGSMPKGDITKEIWKRLYHNLPYLLKTKGTERGIKALMNCYGVPETILNVKEYGGPTTDSTTYKTFNYEKFSRALAGSSDTEGYFIKAPWASSSSLFTGTIESRPNRSEGKIIFSIGAVKDLFNAPFPKTVELTATDLSVHTFTSNYDFLLHEESGLETAQSLAGAIDAHPLFSASVFVREDLYDPAHEKYNLDIEILLTQHLQGIDGNTEIKGTLFEDTLTPACGNPQQFPEVEFLTKVDFKEGGGINNSTSTTTVVPGINTCSSKTLIENGIAADGSGNLINNGLFQDEAEFMDFVTDVANGYTNVDISLYSFESLTPSAVPLYLGEFQCKGINDYGLFVIECFKADDCVNIQSIVTPTTVSPGTVAVGTITIPNNVGQNNGQYDGETVILTSADGTAHTFTLTGGGSVNSIGQDLMNAINADPNFTAINLNTVPQRTGYALEITTVATGSSANSPIQGSALNMTGETAIMSLITNGFVGGTDSTGGVAASPSPNNTCNAILDIYTTDANVYGGSNSISLNFSITTIQYIDYLVQGSTGDPTYDNYLMQSLPFAQGAFIFDNNTNSYVPANGNWQATSNVGTQVSIFASNCCMVYITSTSITANQTGPMAGYLTPTEILDYCSSDCSNVSSTSDTCYTNYTTFIDALNSNGIINSNIPGINVDTKWSELKAPDIITNFPASSSCGCNNFETGAVTTTTVLTQQPTVNTSIPLGQGAQNENYGKFGARFYPDVNSSTFYNIPASVSTYFGGTNQNDGRLNNIGVWDGTNPWLGTNIAMNPMNEWIGFSKCINVPADGEYLIGLAGDNRIRFAVNGEMLIEKNTSNTENFNYWWVYKVNLTAGNNTIVLEGKNDGSIASFGCDIVGPFPTGTFVDEISFQDIDNNGISINGNFNSNLEDAYQNNIIFTSDPGPGQLTPYVDFTIGSGDTDYWQVDSPNQMTIKNGYPQNANLRRWINSFHNLVIGCEYTINYTISNDNGVNSKGLLLFDRQGGNWGGTTHTDGQCWIAEQQGGNNCNNDTFTVTFTATDLHTSGVVDQGGVYFYSSQNQSATITINSITSTTCGGGEFNTQTNSCPEGYLYNECTKLCEKTETTTIGEGDDACPGMIINPTGNGSFSTSTEFVDYFTDFDNGFYGQNIDEYYYESDEPLPWGTFVADQCTGSNGLPIRRVVGFRKDQSILPIDNTLYTNYQTFVNQLNADDHGIETPPTNFTDLTSTLITGSFEGSCQHKTLITNPQTADGSFPTPGSGNTGIVDFLEHYSEQSNNLQSIAVDGLKFPIATGSLVEEFDGICPIEASIYCFYDGTSMTVDVCKNVIETVENWAAEQGADFTGTIYHMVSAHERWLDIARLPFSNIGDHLGNGGWGSVNTIFSTHTNEFGGDLKSLAQDHRGSNFSSGIHSGDKSTLAPREKIITTSHTTGTGNGGDFSLNTIITSPTFGQYNKGWMDVPTTVYRPGNGASTNNNPTNLPLGSGLTVNVFYSTTGVFRTTQSLALPNTNITSNSSGTTAALSTTINGTNAIGTGATVKITSDGNNITGVEIVGVGSGYPGITDETLTVTKTAMDSDGNIGVVGGDLVITLSNNDFNTEVFEINVQNYGVGDPNSDQSTASLYEEGDIITIDKALIGNPTDDIELILDQSAVTGTWHMIPYYGTGDTRSKEISNFVNNSGQLINVGGNMVDIKSVVNDGNGIYDDHIPNTLFSHGGYSNYWRGPAPSLTGSGEKALCFNFYDESSVTTAANRTQYHQSMPSPVNDGFAPTFSEVGLTKAKIEQFKNDHQVGTTNWRSDYELYIKTYLEEVDRSATEYNDQGDLIHLFYPSAPCQGNATGCKNSTDSNNKRGADGTTIFHKTQLSFPLHVWSSILTGSNGGANPGMLETGHEYLSISPPANNAIHLTALDSNGGMNINPYCDADWQNTAGQGTPVGYNADFGYGGLQAYGFRVTDEAVQENQFTPVEFETAVNKVIADTLCDGYEVEEYVDPNICLDEYGNYLFNIEEFFMDPSVDALQVPFLKYTDYITEGQNKGISITLGDTRLESQIGGSIIADECICADACPNDLVTNNNTIITITGSLFDQYNQPFTEGQTITQANNNVFSATVESLDPTSNAIIINITSGTLTFSDPLVDVGTGAQYIPDPSIGEFIIPQPQGVFESYDEYMNFISDPSSGYNQTNLNTLKFQLVSQFAIIDSGPREEETSQQIDILCTGSSSTDINQYGLFTVEGFYQNILVEPSETTNQYPSDPILYTNWYSFITQKISETGATGINFLNNNGANVSIYTTWNDLSSSVATVGTPIVTTTTTPGTPINIFATNNTYTSTFNNSGLNSGINGNPNQQLNWLIDNGHGQNIDGYYFINDTVDETQSPYNTCTGNNLPAGGGAYSVVNDFTFTCIGEQVFSSAAGTYTSWHTFIDTVNSLNYVAGPSTTTTTFNAGSACETGTDTGISGSAYTSSLTYQVLYNSTSTGTNGTTDPSGTVEETYIDYVAQNYGTSNFDQYYFEDTNYGYNPGTCLSYLKYGTGLTLRSNNSTSNQMAAYGFFGGMMQSGTTYSIEYTTWNSFIDALNVEENFHNKGATPFNYTDSLEDVLLLIDTLQDDGRYSYEGNIATYNIELNVESCECSTTTIPGGQVQQDIFTYQDDITDVLNYFNGTLEINYSANFIVNTTEATCEEVPGEEIVTEITESTAGNIPLYGQIDGGACVCVPETTGGESLDGDIEFESCICCPESSSVAVGCLVAGEVSSSRCECSADTYETVIHFVSASSFDIIPSSSAKMVEFRIKPHRLDKPEYTSLEACCDPIVTIPTASHLFSLFNPSQPQTTPHLVLRPHTGSDVSASDDFRNFGSLDLYKNGSVVGSTDIFPVYNGAFWNIFIGTKGESGSNSEVYFGAYQSNFLGHVTHLTASATFSEYERAASFGDTAYNITNNTLPAPTAYFCGVPTNTNSSLGDINTFKYSGSLQEIKYHVKDFLTHDTLTKHALDPFQYAGNTVSSSWHNVHLRLPLGSNNKVDSASYNNNGLGIIQNFNPHPSFSLYESSSISSSVTNQVFSEVYETHRHLTPDTVGISTTSEKVRIDSGSVDRSILSFDIKAEDSTLDRQPLDYNDLGVFFSPQAEINEDIVYTLGAFRMDDYIGDPTHQSLAEYPDLEELKLEYFRKYLNSHKQNMFDYIRLIQFIDHTLFKVVEQFVPAKANLKTGLLVEPHYLERQKFARQIPTFERLEKEVEIDPYLVLKGKVEQFEACINISDLNNENYYAWKGALTASDNLYMSQSKYASDECNSYITLYDNFDPLYGNYVDCIHSKEYYYVSKPPQFYQNDPVNTGINPNIGINPPNPSKPSGYAATQVLLSKGNAVTSAVVASALPALATTSSNGAY